MNVNNFNNTCIIQLSLQESPSRLTQSAFTVGILNWKQTDIEKLKENFAIVRPVCSSCYNKGMQPATRNAKKTKRQRTN